MVSLNQAIQRSHVDSHQSKINFQWVLDKNVYLSIFISKSMPLKFDNQGKIVYGVIQTSFNSRPFAYTRDLLQKASQLLTNFVGNSFQNISKIFKRGVNQQNKNQTKQSKKSEEVVLVAQPIKTGEIQQLQRNRVLNFQDLAPEQFTQSEQAKSQAGKKSNETKNASTQFYDFERVLTPEVQINVQNLLEHEGEAVQVVKLIDDSQEEEQLKRHMKGSKKIKIQWEQTQKSREARLIQFRKEQTLQTTRHFIQLRNQVVTDIASEQTQPIDDQEVENVLLQMKKQAEQQYQRKTRMPKSKEVKEMKDARKMLREAKAREQDVQKRFQLYKLERRRKTKNNLKISLMEELKNLGQYVPTLQKILQQHRQLELKNKQKRKQVEQAALLFVAEDKKQVQPFTRNLSPLNEATLMPEKRQIQVLTQPQRTEKALRGINSIQSKSIEQKKYIPASSAEEKAAESAKPLIEQGIVGNISIGQIFKSLANKKKPQVIQLNQESDKRVQQPNLMNQASGNKGSKEQQKAVQKNSIFQTPNKPSNPFSKLQLRAKTNATTQSVRQTTPQTQLTVTKPVNPFLGSAPSIKINMEDIISKNPQFSIFSSANKQSLGTVSTPVPNPAANIFKLGSSNPANIFNKDIKQGSSQMQGQVQVESNIQGAHPRNPNNDWIQNSNTLMTSETIKNPTNLQRTYVMPALEAHSLQSSNLQSAYQPGKFADPVKSRNLFESPRPEHTMGLFPEFKQPSNNQYSSKGYQGSSRHKKGHNVRIS